jgi:Tfp pilus assembly protein PilV
LLRPAALFVFIAAFSGPSVGQGACVHDGVPVHALPDNHGFSLIEALVASVVLATALISLAQLLAAAATANAAAGRTTHAALLAAQKIEELRASPWIGSEERASDSPEAGFTREWTVSPLPSDPGHAAIIQVVVSAAGSRTRLVALKAGSAP